MSRAANPKILDSCVPGSDDTYIILNCSVTNAPLADIDDGWSLVPEGDTLVMHVKTDSGATGEESSVDLGAVSITVTFPGDILSVEGNGVTKTAPDTIVAKGSIDETLDFTVTAAASSEGGIDPIWIRLAGFIVVIGGLALLLLMRRSGARPRADCPVRGARSFHSRLLDTPPARLHRARRGDLGKGR